MATFERMSLPTRGAWIEISLKLVRESFPQSRSPHGERGLKSTLDRATDYYSPVAPHTGSVD